MHDGSSHPAPLRHKIPRTNKDRPAKLQRSRAVLMFDLFVYEIPYFEKW